MKRNLEFLFEIGSLRNVQRGWRQHVGDTVANDLEHTMRVVWLALLIARMEGVNEEEKIIKMALAHDLCETRVSDLSYVQKCYMKAREDDAVHDLFTGTMLSDFEDLIQEFETRESIASKIVKDADNLDIDFEQKELEVRGSKLPDKWKPFRRLVRDEKLYTESARKIWDMLQTADPDSWHLEMNKWITDPNAGK